MDENVFTINNQIKTVKKGYSHVVILGAGASLASCIDNPEKNGREVPLMKNLSEVIDISNELKDSACARL